jgi:WD40 repeat protein
MSDPPAALRTVWRSPVPHATGGPVAFAPSGDRLAAGTGGDGLAGSLTVFETRTGAVVHQVSDTWQVHSLAYSPDGRSLATSERRFGFTPPAEVRVRVLDAEAGTFTERCHATGDLRLSPSYGLGFSGDGAWITARESLFGTPGSLAYMFAAADGAERWRFTPPAISGIAVSSDAGSVAVGCFFQLGVAVIDAGTGLQRLSIPLPSDIRSVAYSPDDRWIVAGCQDGTIHVFDAGDGGEAWSARLGIGPDDAIVSVTVSDDSRWAAAVGAVNPGGTGILGVYDLVLRTPRFPPVPLGNFGKACFSPTLRHIIVDGPDALPRVPGNPHPISVIDARTGLHQSTSASAVQDFAISPDGASVAAQGAGFVEMYDLGVAVSRSTVEASLTSIAVSFVGDPLVAVAHADSAVSVIVASSGARVARKPVPGTVSSLVFADQGRAIAAGSSDGVRLFSVVGGQSWTVDGIGAVNALAVAGAAGDWIATAAGRTVRLLSSADGTARWPNPVIHPQTVTRVAAGPDGKRIATGCADRHTRILDALTGAETFSVKGDGRVRALAFTPDATLLGTANEDGTIVLVDPAAGSERSRLTRLFGCSEIAFSTDGTLLAAAWDDNRVSVHDLTSGESPPPKLRELAFAAPVSGLAFNPAEHTIAIAVAGASLVVYDARDGIELVRILQPAPVGHFAFTADGALIATAGEDRVVRVWTSGTDKEVLP